ncbi:prepilin-type N-terminal cleavage/methylation domain-containing protein [Facklamia sp. DSM 111018]|uniref:Prepilin-type N-terminal cleavage/methylation domain-containing protein n=1 Tax=Facklamia lactis TaxID=2749967 RepID=A0ABS0LRK3_9LACT|nr:competence type IV pilus major pilin ComGC [Facklamia lactis]MBG9980970.1 prepilin-type N-terminal cleavage/methylation domain-containing protein [Facklamia lactis]MBG9986667.1 prepilin-type N-terminal cleavage/methylation domain-containing protein [Facklamia lactis]
MNKFITRLSRICQHKNIKKGFTLLEMTIVLIVVAILMAIIIPNVAGQKERIDQQATENITEIISTQAHAYYLVEGNSATASLETLVAEGYLTERQAEEALERIDPSTLSVILSDS